MMTDPEICSVRIITAAGEGAGDRLRQAVTGFQLFSYPADAVVLSRVLPEEGAGDFFAAAAAAQKECLNTIGQAVGAMPVLRTSLRPEPPRGQEALAEVAGEVYAAHAPEAMLHRSEKRVVFHENGRYEMNLALPYAAKEDLSLEQLEDSVVVYLGGHRCVLSLPEEVRRYSSASWSFEEQTLKVTFSR
jgi:arsenite-transporting ATPase